MSAHVSQAVLSVSRNFLFGPRHLGAYTLLPPTEPFQRIFRLRDGPSGSQPPAASPEHLQWSPAPSVFSDTTTSRGLGIEFPTAPARATPSEPAAQLSAPACWQTTASSDDPPPRATNNSGHVSPVARRSSPAS